MSDVVVESTIIVDALQVRRRAWALSYATGQNTPLKTYKVVIILPTWVGRNWEPKKLVQVTKMVFNIRSFLRIPEFMVFLREHPYSFYIIKCLSNSNVKLYFR